MSVDAYPSEHDILNQTLVVPSSLPSILSLNEFSALFPASLRNHSHVAVLYRALQQERGLDIDHVRENIDHEVQRGQKQLRDLHKAIAKGSTVQELDIEDHGSRSLLATGTDGALQDNLIQGNTSAYQRHSLTTIIPALENAAAIIEAEISDQERELSEAQAALEASIGDLSDLRYGRLNKPHLRRELLDNLKTLASKSEDSYPPAR